MDKSADVSMVCSHPYPGLVLVAAHERCTTGRKQMTAPNIKAPGSKLDLLIKRLRRPSGATIDDLTKVTGWQAHSVRGAMSGTLKKKGHSIASTKVDGKRRYQLLEPSDA